jgi:hypothetical protein
MSIEVYEFRDSNDKFILLQMINPSFREMMGVKELIFKAISSKINYNAIES